MSRLLLYSKVDGRIRVVPREESKGLLQSNQAAPLTKSPSAVLRKPYSIAPREKLNFAKREGKPDENMKDAYNLSNRSDAYLRSSSTTISSTMAKSLPKLEHAQSFGVKSPPRQSPGTSVPVVSVRISAHRPTSRRETDIVQKKQTTAVMLIEPPGLANDGDLSLNNFNLLWVIGRGGFGKVWKVEAKKTKRFYAMKEMMKCRVLSKRSVNSVMNERYLLSYLRHPFLVNMIAAFQDRESMFLVMDLLTGGDLRFHICKKRRFTEEQTKFVIACIVVALEYLHNHGILHRDIKPENIVLDSDGYCRVTDLGVARAWREENSQDTSGTPGYMAPEVICRQNHGVAVDYFALGVIAYEMMLGKVSNHRPEFIVHRDLI